MSNFLDKVQINTAIVDNSKFDLSCDHITTGSFFSLAPVYIKEMVPGERISINSEVFSRLQPLVHPTFGRCNINIRGFFVPMRVLWHHWNDFIVDTASVVGQQGWNSIIDSSRTIMPNVPYFQAGDLVDLILKQVNFDGNQTPYGVAWGTATETVLQPGQYDMTISIPVSGASTVQYIKLNYFGRQALKILESLGYRVPTVKTTAYKITDGPKISAMPLLALAKIYIDWYVNSQYYTMVPEVRTIEGFLHSTAITNAGLSFEIIAKILKLVMKTNYDSDYFVSAWDNPSGPVSGLYSSLTFSDATVDHPVAGNTQAASTQFSDTGATNTTLTNGTPTAFGNYTAGGVGYTQRTSPVLSQYVLDALKSLTDFMKRNQISGARVFDRYLARFGKVLSNEKQERVVYLGSHKSGVQFGDVMSTSNTNNELGQYAGKGIAYSSGPFEYSSDEYGYIILTSSIVPATNYYQGIDRSIMHLSATDFWTPEFDNLGVQAISAAELYMSKNTNPLGNFGSMWNQVFGFAPRYAEYKVPKDRLTGDFVMPSLNTGLDSWHMFRTFNDGQFGQTVSNVVHSFDFTEGYFDGDQYNRIFKDWNTQDLFTRQDMFWLIYHFDVTDYAPMKSLFDTYEFEEKGKTVTEEVNGVKVN